MSSLERASRSSARAASAREDATRDVAATIQDKDIFVKESASKAASNARDGAREREYARAMKADVVCGGDGRAGKSRSARGRGRRRGARRLLDEASASTSRSSDPGADARSMVKNEALLARERECAVRDEIWATRLEDDETTGYDFEATLEELWMDWWWKMSRGERLSAEKASVMDMLTAIVNGTSSRDIETGVRRVSVAEASESSDCPVCLEDDDSRADIVRLTRCEHTFHIDCIAPWLQRHKTCPKCRARVR